MTDVPSLPDERTVETSDGEEVEVRETVTEVSISASRKVQLDQYEPITGHVSLTAEKPPEGDFSASAFDAWLEGLADIAWKEAERSVLERYEQYVREEAFGDDD